MTKLNNKGFALAETLITTVFVMFIFSVIYTNYMPIMAEYERRETYDDIDGKYAAYWMKKVIEGTTVRERLFNGDNSIKEGDFKKIDFSDSNFSDATVTTGINLEYCTGPNADIYKCYFPNYVDALKELVDYLQIKAIYITPYNLQNMKNYINIEDDNIDANLKDYLDYLPKFICKSGGCPSHRVIVEMVRKNNQEVTDSDGVDEMNQVYAYSTIGVD